MKHARMEALGITVPLGKNQYFSDDGYVEDLGEHALSLKMRYGMGNSPVPTKDVFGHCFSLKTVRKDITIDNVHIYYLKLDPPVVNIMNRAHEETHALQHLGKLKYLFLDMTVRGTVPPFSRLLKHMKEEVADVGGVYAMQKRKLI